MHRICFTYVDSLVKQQIFFLFSYSVPSSVPKIFFKKFYFGLFFKILSTGEREDIVVVTNTEEQALEGLEKPGIIMGKVIYTSTIFFKVLLKNNQ